MKYHILVVEDELKLAELIRDYLLNDRYQCSLIADGDEVLPWLKNNQPDLILLDLMLPGTDGLSLCSQIRRFSKVPIIMITARVEEIDRLLGLELGADDYICKPFSLKEVMARIKAVLRRSSNQLLPIDQSIHINIDLCRLTINHNEIDVTLVEAKLMQILLNNPGRIYSRRLLMDSIYSDHRVVSERTIDSHIKKLRKKIKTIQPDVELIESVYGVGYRLDENVL